MTGAPDPKPERRARRAIRTVDPDAGRRALLLGDECLACGAPSGNAHHLVPKGSPHFGDDVEANLIPLCGSGSDRCHGALHGSPYLVQIGHWVLDVERRDSEWVRRRIGERLPSERPDSVLYVLVKLGDEAGRDWLRRRYFVEV